MNPSSKPTPNPEAFLTLAELNRELGTVSLNGSQLQALGFKGINGAELSKQIDDPYFARKFRAAKLYRLSDVPRIRAAIARAMRCNTGESYVIGNLLSIAPRYLPAGYSVTLQASPAGHTLSLSYPDGKSAPVNCATAPLSNCLKSAIECARAHASNAAKEKVKPA